MAWLSVAYLLISDDGVLLLCNGAPVFSFDQTITFLETTHSHKRRSLPSAVVVAIPQAIILELPVFSIPLDQNIQQMMPFAENQLILHQCAFQCIK